MGCWTSYSKLVLVSKKLKNGQDRVLACTSRVFPTRVMYHSACMELTAVN